ncbi:MAG: IS5 family transposase [Verrucomicrobiales bacterium]
MLWHMLSVHETTLPMVGAAEKAALKNGGARMPRRRGRPRIANEQALEALFYRLRHSGPWRDLPSHFGKWRTIYGRHREWAQSGLWMRILRKFCKAAKGRVRFVDGTHIPVHQAGANPAGGQATQAMGRTRGGRNTKLMALTDEKGRALALSLIPGQTYEPHHVVGLLEKAVRVVVVGDRGFDDDHLRQELLDLGHCPLFPSKSNRKHKMPVDKRLYRKRYRIENYFCRLKRWAGAAVRRDKLAPNFLSIVAFASVLDWLRCP